MQRWALVITACVWARLSGRAAAAVAPHVTWLILVVGGAGGPDARAQALGVEVEYASPSPTPTVIANSDDRLIQLANQLAAEPAAPPTPPVPSARVDSAVPVVSQPRAISTATPPAPSESRTLLGPRTAAPGRAPRGNAPPGALTDGGLSNPATNSGLGGGSWVLDTLTALGAVIGVILLVKAGHKKWATRGGRIPGNGLAVSGAAGGGVPVVEVLGRTALAPRSQLLIVRLGTRILVLGDGPGGLRTLAQLDDDEEVAQLVARLAPVRADSISSGFNQLLGRFHREYRDDQHRLDEGRDEQEHVIDRARDQLGSLLSRMRTLGHGGPTAPPRVPLGKGGVA